MTASVLKMDRDKTELLVLNRRRRPLPPSTQARNTETTQKNDKNEDVSIPLFSVEGNSLQQAVLSLR